MHYLLTWQTCCVTITLPVIGTGRWIQVVDREPVNKVSGSIVYYKYLPENYRRTYYNSYNSKLICTHIQYGLYSVCRYVGMCVCVHYTIIWLKYPLIAAIKPCAHTHTHFRWRQHLDIYIKWYISIYIT